MLPSNSHRLESVVEDDRVVAALATGRVSVLIAADLDTEADVIAGVVSAVEAETKHVLNGSPAIEHEDDRLRADGGTSDTERLPLLPWCRDCWDSIGDPDGDLPDECPDCGSTEVLLL